MNNLPANEQDRLKALLELKILDTEKDQALDDIIEMAGEICSVPISGISFIDSDRQWFKATKNLNLTETTREVSFCSHVVASGEILIVEDTFHDERFRNNPFVTGVPGLRFYAGFPLILSNGFTVGTLCVLDLTPGKLSEKQIRHMKILANQVVAQIELKQKLNELQVVSKIVFDQQEKIKSQERLAVIGKLSSGVSHEINNPLAIISGSVLVVKSMLQKGESIDVISKQLTRIDQTVTRLTNIGRVLRSISSSRMESLSDPETIEKTFHRMIEEARKIA